MEKLNFDRNFDEANTKLESSKLELKKLLEEEILDETSRIRLTRVLQLVERYRPERNSNSNKEEQGQSLWLKYIETFLRSLPALTSHLTRRKEKPKQEDPEKLPAKSFLTAEKTIQNLRELRHFDFEIYKEQGFSDDEIIDQERSGEVIKKETLDSSLSLSYEQKNWGVERICLDGVQNHLPSDSKGERVWVKCLIDGEWLDIDRARANQEKIEAVRFADDGVGFDVKNLVLLHSTKAGEQGSVGQFGEGIKMISAAALREGIDVEFESQDWRARPVAKPVTFKNTRDKKEEEIKQLTFAAEYLNGEPMIGSRTTFWKPNQQFIDEVLKVEEKVLALDKKYRPVFVGETGQIAKLEPGKMYIKGILVGERDTLLSYNFNDIQTNRDRNTTMIHEGTLDRKIKGILSEISDVKLVKTLIARAVANPGQEGEDYHYSITPKTPTVWVTAFYELFGEDAVIDTGFEPPKNLKVPEMKKIKLPRGLQHTLIKAGVKTEQQAIPDFYEETIKTSLTLDYGKDVWGEERILLDTIQNHLPHDSGGCSIWLRFKTKDGKWRDYNEISHFKNEDIEALKVSDDGRGYEVSALELLHSTKEGTEAAGRFGEGLKMVSAAALRSNIGITLRSRDWVASPVAIPREVNGLEVNQLGFQVVNSIKDKKPKPDDPYDAHSRSSTTFEKPSIGLIDEFRTVDKKVLALNSDPLVDKTETGDIVSLGSGLLYAREIIIPGDHQLMFSYHFPKIEIKNRDRNTLSPEELKGAVGSVLERTGSPEVIRTFLLNARIDAQGENRNGKTKLEFDVDFLPKDSGIWKKVFEETFGSDVSVRDVRGDDFNAMHQNLHVGLELISMPSSVARMLEYVGLPTYKQRLYEMTDVIHIPYEELTGQEKEILELLPMIDEFLPGNRSSEIVVYEPKYSGQHVAAGFADGSKIHLSRSTLSFFERAADVYVHEKTHHNTSLAPDASAGFRNYLTLAASSMALSMLDKLKSARAN
ncbi:MAG: Uncharacterized protein G01um101420_838 [Parcubacteria group bacterium Gr01-1014_20]|nr:MAG: Uncharacterized protein G01um101420_838 [Parcubacteria group bacterium Gr01-1014_20]